MGFAYTTTRRTSCWHNNIFIRSLRVYFLYYIYTTLISLIVHNSLKLSSEFRQGQYEVRMWANKIADGCPQTTTPGIISDSIENDTEEASSSNTNDGFPILDELDRLAKVF